jgi:hypothetical protein
VAFACNRQTPIGSVEIPPGQPWVTPVSEQDLLDEFSGWGSDVITLLGCIRKPSKWCIHAVHPPLETYVNGNIALIGDSVCTPIEFADLKKKALCSLILSTGARHVTSPRSRCWSRIRRCACALSTTQRPTDQRIKHCSCVYIISTAHSF